MTYAMRAMGLMKLSEISAQYLKRNTGIEVSWYKSTSSSSGSGGDGQSSSSSNENVADTNDEGDMLVKEEPASDSVVAAVKEGQDAENLPPDVNVENRREDVVVQIKLEPHVCAAAAAADALTPGFRQRKSPRRRSSETENKEDTYW